MQRMVGSDTASAITNSGDQIPVFQLSPCLRALPISAFSTPIFHTHFLWGLLLYVCIISGIRAALFSTKNYLLSDIMKSHTFLEYKCQSPTQCHQFSCSGLFLLLMIHRCFRNQGTCRSQEFEYIYFAQKCSKAPLTIRNQKSQRAPRSN